MLVMRNFGYLGLHQVVDSSSTLARDRLVDFSESFNSGEKRNGGGQRETETQEAWLHDYFA